MEDAKSNRLSALRVRALRSRFQTLQTLLSAYRRAGGFQGSRAITDADLAAFPEVCSIIDISPDVELTLDSLHRQLGPHMLELLSRWRTDMEARLSEVVSSHVNVPIGTSPLDLAIAVFECRHCQKRHWFPDVLDHNCSSAPFASFGMFNPHMDVAAVYQKEATAMLGCSRSSLYSFRRCSQLVINMMGKDPERTTAAEMDALDTKIACRMCGDELMTWRAAVSGSFHSFNTSVTSQLQISHWNHWFHFHLEGCDVGTAGVSLTSGFRCFHCPRKTWWSSSVEITSHLQSWSSINPLMRDS